MRGAMLATVAAALMAAVLFQGTEGRAQDGVEAAYRAARAGSPTPGALEQAQAEWRRFRNEDLETGQEVEDQERADWLSGIAARDQAVGAARPGLLDLSRGCLPMALLGCDVYQGGFLADGDGNVLYWQLQEGATAETGITGAVVFLVPDGERLRPVGWAAEAAKYTSPVLIADEGGRWYVATSGIAAGSASGNVDVIFRWTPGAERPLTEVDDWSWRESLQAQLPEGLEVWQGVRWDWENMMALTPLWRADDGNCCGSGGDAILNFEFQGDRLALTGVNATDAAVSVVGRTPIDVLAFVQRAQVCAQWGPDAASPDLPQAVRDRITAARCGTLETDRAALLDAHSSERAIADLIARAAVR